MVLNPSGAYIGDYQIKIILKDTSLNLENTYNTTISVVSVSNLTSDMLNKIKEQTIEKVILSASIKKLDDDGSLQILFNYQIQIPSLSMSELTSSLRISMNGVKDSSYYGTTWDVKSIDDYNLYVKVKLKEYKSLNLYSVRIILNCT